MTVMLHRRKAGLTRSRELAIIVCGVFLVPAVGWSIAFGSPTVLVVVAVAAASFILLAGSV